MSDSDSAGKNSAHRNSVQSDAKPSSVRFQYWVELFATGNLGFLALDIYLAHSVNQFAHWAEWVPFWFSIAAPLALMPGLVRRRYRVRPQLGLWVGSASVVVGIAGLLLHLDSQFFRTWSLKALVYTAPLVAPLAYAGLGMLLLLNRLEQNRPLTWARWVIVLAALGFFGNFFLSLMDHAQNGFFHSSEWVPVVSAAFATTLLFAVTLKPRLRLLWRVGLAVLGVQVLVGLLGFWLHLASIWLGPADATWWQRLIFGAPPLAPLLFVDLAALGAIALFALPAASHLPPGRVQSPV